MNICCWRQINQIKRRDMGLFDFIFKSREERRKEKEVRDVLRRTDDFIEKTERMLDWMQKDDRKWRNGL